MSIVQRTRELIAQGQTDRITSIPLRLPKYEEYLYGLRQKTMITLMAESSVGKTSFARDKFYLTPFEYYKQINDPTKLDVEFIDFSLEIDAPANVGTTIGRKIYMDYQRVIPPHKLFGWYGTKLNDDEKRMIREIEPYLEELESKTTVIEGEIGPEAYHGILFAAAKRNGTFEVEGPDIGTSSGYRQTNPNKFVIVVFDTLNLVELEAPYLTTKQAMDRISRLGVLFRNTCNFIIINLQQISAEIASTDRLRHTVTTPKINDAEDTRRPTKDSDIVIALYDPIPHMKEDATLFKGYDISILKSWFKSLHILKNRQGPKHKFIPLKSHGAIAYFEQLPEAKDMTPEDYIQATRH